MQKKLLILIPLLFLHNSYAAELAAALIQNNVMIDQELKTQSRVPKLAALSLRSLTNTMFSKEFLRKKLGE